MLNALHIFIFFCYIYSIYIYIYSKKLHLLVRVFLICLLFAYGGSLLARNMVGMRVGGGFMHNYNQIWGGEIGFVHTGSLNCCSNNSLYGYDLRVGIYFDRYFNILDGTTFPRPLYRRYLIPISFGSYLSLQGLLEQISLVNAKRKLGCKQSKVDLHLGLAPSLYTQIVKSIPENMQKLSLIPSEHPVLRGVDLALFLGLNASSQLNVNLNKIITLNLRGQLDFFLIPVPIGDFPNSELQPGLPAQRTRASMSLNRNPLPSILLAITAHLLYNRYKVNTKYKYKLFKGKRNPFK